MKFVIVRTILSLYKLTFVPQRDGPIVLRYVLTRSAHHFSASPLFHLFSHGGQAEQEWRVVHDSFATVDLRSVAARPM